MKCAKCNFNNPPGTRFCAHCGTGFDLRATPSQNMRSTTGEIERGTYLFGRYEVIEKIGAGGMGAVYRVFDTTIHEIVALKIIRPEIATDKSVIERFGLELKTARKISHRNVCRMFDIGEEDGTNYITMEYVTGEDLRSLINRIGQLNVAKAIDIAKQICEGLAEAHAMGIIHRDLKPQNIMIDRDGMAKIMDFGIARFISTKGMTTTGTIVGTPEYMSPEQSEGKGVDQRSDIYSLGIVLFEALTGRTPFEGETPLSVALKHMTEKPPDPRTFNLQVPGDLGNLVLRCLEKEKDARYQTVAEILSDLNLIAQGIPIRPQAGADGKPRHSKKRIDLRAGKILLSGGTILAIAAVALGAWHLWLRPKPPDTIVSDLESGLRDREPAEKIAAPKTNGDFQTAVSDAKTDPPKIAAEQPGSERIHPQQDPPPLATAQEPQDQRRAIEADIRKGLAAALKAYDSGHYQESLKQSRFVLKIEPGNEQARNYENLAKEKLAEADINSLIDRYEQAFKINPIEFYKSCCTPQVYEEIGKDAELLFSLYENFKPSASNRNIRLTGTERAEVSFYQRLMGTRKGTVVEQDVWSGTMRWNLERQKGTWRITAIVFQPLK